MGKQAKSASLEIAPVPGFFGHEIKPGQPLKWANDVEEFAMQLNSAALGAEVAKGRSTLYVVAKQSKIALCTLTPQASEQWNLTQIFTPMDGEIEFVVDGANAIHLTGLIEVQEEEDDHEHDFDQEDDSDDDIDPSDMMVFEGDSDDDEEESEGEEDDDEDDEGRFEVVEERLHLEKEKKSPAKKSPVKEEKKAPAKEEKKAPAKEQKKTPAKEDKPAAKKEKEAAPATKKEKKEAAKKEAAKKEAAKKAADKIAELTASAGKKRPAPSDAVDVPKKMKTTRQHKGVTIEEQYVSSML